MRVGQSIGSVLVVACLLYVISLCLPNIKAHATVTLRMRVLYGDAGSSSDGDDGIPDVRNKLSTALFDAKMHEFLCGRSTTLPGIYLGPDHADDGEWKQVRRQGDPGKPGRRHPGNRKIPTKAEADPVMVKRFSKIFRDYFYGVTGRPIPGFELTPSSHKYVSMLYSARERDRVLATMFQTRPVVWDLMAGSGADVLAFLLDLNPRLVIACQRAMIPDDKDPAQYAASLEEFKVMERNIQEFANAFPELNIIIRSSLSDQHTLSAGEGEEDDAVEQYKPPTVKCKHLHAETFIRSQPEGTEVDMIYLDPSWDDDYDQSAESARKFELSPTELFKRLETIIWGPIKQKKIKVGCYVIKTRWNWLKVQQYLPEINSEFIAKYSIRAQPFRKEAGPDGPYGQKQGVFHYMILEHREYQTIVARNNRMYWDIVRNGKPVWVRRDTVVHPAMPVYSNQLSNPEFVESEPLNSEAYFLVEPPPPLAPRRHAVKAPDDPSGHGYYDNLPQESSLSARNTPHAKT